MLEPLSSLSEGAYFKDVGSNYGSIHGTLVRAYGSDVAWLKRWRGDEAGGARLTLAQIPGLEVLKKRWRDCQGALDAYLSYLSDDVLASPLFYVDDDGLRHFELLADQVLHKVNCSTYYRGQVASMLKRLGSIPKSTDFRSFLGTDDRKGSSGLLLEHGDVDPAV